jgi:hypothetical protein
LESELKLGKRQKKRPVGESTDLFEIRVISRFSAKHGLYQSKAKHEAALGLIFGGPLFSGFFSALLGRLFRGEFKTNFSGLGIEC